MKLRYIMSLCVLIFASLFVQAQEVIVPDIADLVPLIVAKDYILRGEPVTEDVLTTIYIHEEDYTESWVRGMSAIVDLYVDGDVMPYQPIHTSYIVGNNPVIGACTLPAGRSAPASISASQLQTVKELDVPITYGLRATLLIETNVVGVDEPIFIPIVEDVEFLCRTPDDYWVVTMASHEHQIYLTQIADAGAIIYVAPLVPINIHGE